jgi:hypothetical protein
MLYKHILKLQKSIYNGSTTIEKYYINISSTERLSVKIRIKVLV